MLGCIVCGRVSDGIVLTLCGLTERVCSFRCLIRLGESWNDYEHGWKMQLKTKKEKFEKWLRSVAGNEI